MTTPDKGPRDDRWYLNIMAPNTKGDKFAWLDPTSIYINAEAFNDLLDDLLEDLKDVECDVVAGLDAMGFVLGAAIAARRGVGSVRVHHPDRRRGARGAGDRTPQDRTARRARSFGVRAVSLRRHSHHRIRHVHGGGAAQWTRRSPHP